MTTMKKFHWFWAWNDEKEETWLREMSQKGWHFKSIGFPSNYTFEQGEPTDYVYRLDYFVDAKNKDHYLQLFLDTGWDHMGEMGSWQYFRKEAVNGKAPEIYNDNESKRKKYERIMLFLIIFLPIYINFIVILNRSENSIMKVFAFVMFALIVLYSFAMIRLLQRIKQLKKKI